MSSARVQAAWSWTQHLRGGGGTPWTSWVAAGPHAGEPPADWQAPGAAQLELVRRVGLVGAGAAGFPRVADLALTRSGPGRGLAQQPLLWPGESGTSYGAPAVDPADVPSRELVRVGVGVLTELLLALPPTPTAEERRRRRWTRGPAYELAGAPLTAASVRAGLGVPEGGRDPVVVVLAAPFDTLMAQVWSARVQRGAPVRWAGFVERWSSRARLPPSADLSALAAQGAARVGRDRVHVVVPGARTDASRTTRELLGLRSAHRVAPARWADLGAPEVDLLRRVNAVLAVRLPEDRLRPVASGLADLLAAEAGERPDPRGSAGLTVPEPFEDWAAARARELADGLAAGGYPVHGDLADLAPTVQGPRRPDLDGVLRRVISACLTLATRMEEPA